MRHTCRACGLRFEREQGYFVGAMYFSYGLAVLLVLPTIVAMWLWGFSAGAIYLAACLELVLLAPFLFRYARVLWLYLDQVIDPR